MRLNNLKTRLIGKRIIFLQEIDSTNSEARRLVAHGEKEGTVIIADSQVKGRGRHDRRWVSPPGGLYLSVILKPYVNPSKLSLITLLCSIAVVRTIRGLFKLPADVKWPNDIVIHGKKIGGVLCEAKNNNVIAGIGVNLNTNISLFPQALRKQVTSLRFELGANVNKDKFVSILLEEVEGLYRDFLHRRYEDIVLEWSSYCQTLGQKVKIETERGVEKGIAEAIGKRGELNLRGADGKIKKVFSEDVINVHSLEQK